MQSNRSNTLGGEGCPAADIQKPAQNRNISDDLYGHPSLISALSRRTVQEQTGLADTPLTQQAELLTALCSEFEAWADRTVLTPAEAEHVRHITAYLRMDRLPAPLRADLARHVTALCSGR